MTLGVGMFEALAERHHVRKLLIVGELVDGKLPDGRNISLVYDPADGPHGQRLHRAGADATGPVGLPGVFAQS